MISSSRALLFALVAGSASAFAPSAHRQSAAAVATGTGTRGTELRMGFFDNIKTVFSDEGKEARKKFEEEEKLKEEEAQREMVERRKNPEKMEEYGKIIIS